MQSHLALGAGSLLALVAGTVVLRDRAAAAAPVAADLQLEAPPIPAEVAGPLSFGFGSLLADFTFLEAIQALALRKSNQPAAEVAPLDRSLARLIEYSTDVDPRFAGAYRFAGMALPHETPDGKAPGVIAAVQILKRGVRERADDWHISFLLGFLQAYYLGEFAASAENLALAARQPGSPPYLGLLATRVAAQGGQLATALELAETMLAQATEEETREAWRTRLDQLQMEKVLRQIDAAASRYRVDHGTWPPSIEALSAAGYLERVPREPHGGRYLLLPDGTARSSTTERLRIYGGIAHLEVR